MFTHLRMIEDEIGHDNQVKCARFCIVLRKDIQQRIDVTAPNVALRDLGMRCVLRGVEFGPNLYIYCVIS
jgi:hypothetical protein